MAAGLVIGYRLLKYYVYMLLVNRRITIDIKLNQLAIAL